MSNTAKHRPAPNRSGSQSKSSEIDKLMTTKSSSAKKFPWVWAIVGALVVVAGVIAVLSAGGDDEDVTVGTVAEGGGSSSAGEFQPVTVDGAALAPFAETAGDLAVGTTAPVLSGFDFDGNPIKIEPTGDPTMVVFLAHWCPHCNNEIPVLNEWRDAGLMPDGLQVVGVSTAAVPNREFYPPSKWLEDREWEWPVMADSEANEAAQAFGVSGFPAIMILDGEGKVLSRASGELGALALQQFVADALAAA